MCVFSTVSVCYVFQTSTVCVCQVGLLLCVEGTPSVRYAW